MKKAIWIFLLLSGLGNFPALCLADEVTDWNLIMLDALRTGAIGGVVATRHAAIVQSAVYDAVNGIERRYEPLHVQPSAAPGASRRAAAVQAAYASLLKFFPGQKSNLDSKRDSSLSAISSEEGAGNSQSITLGIEWGQQVADAIWSWRSTDGFTPAPAPYYGVAAPGQWRSTPPAFAGNSNTIPDTNWTPLIVTPPYPDYPSDSVASAPQQWVFLGTISERTRRLRWKPTPLAPAWLVSNAPLRILPQRSMNWSVRESGLPLLPRNLLALARPDCRSSRLRP